MMRMKHARIMPLAVCALIVFCALGLYQTRAGGQVARPALPGAPTAPAAPAAPSVRAAAPAAPGTAVPDQKPASEDGPPIDLTCVGQQVPATVHVTALPPRTDAPAPTPDHPVALPLDASPIAYSYVWDFGDPQGRYNQLPGWNAAHVYDKPGKYTITLTVTDAFGKKTHRTSWVRIAPDTRKRVYVSNAGSDGPGVDGSTPNRPVRSVYRAMQLAQSDAVVLFRRGDRFEVPHQISINGRNVRLTNYADIAGRVIAPPGAPVVSDPPAAEGGNEAGNPDLPVLYKVSAPDGKNQELIFYVNPKSSEITFDGLEFDSQWTLKDPTLPKPWEKIPARAINAAGTNCTVRDCSFRNLTDAVNAELKPTGLLVQDCRFSNEIRGYGIYGNGTDHVYVGNLMLHSRTEHLIRVTEPGVTRLLIAYNDLYRPTTGKGSIELRNANWYYVSDNVVDGGSVRVGPQEQDPHQFPNWKQI
jgi:hypothetical protein